jgi:thiol-disulfide isomerase/thioredoxin
LIVISGKINKMKILKLTLSLILLLLLSQLYAQSYGINVGNKAPNIIGMNIAGDSINLETLKGDLVLIDFWASWCGPCVKGKPEIVEAYNQYKDASFNKGESFKVFSVSLDQQKNRWESTVERLGMNWEWHVSDLKGWHSEYAKLYRVNSIPANFLINGDGVIIAKNLRGPMLKKVLSEQLKAE